MSFFRIHLLSHAIYILVTGIWPIADIRSFMMVTGPKEDIWLVKTVGALLIPVALCMLSYLRLKTSKWPVIILAMGIAIAFICIDIHYATTDIISDIYLVDAAVQFLFLLGWLFLTVKYIRKILLVI